MKNEFFVWKSKLEALNKRERVFEDDLLSLSILALIYIETEPPGCDSSWVARETISYLKSAEVGY